MQDFKNLETGVLVDMLSAQTKDHTEMLKEGANQKELMLSEYEIASIQAELNLRQQTAITVTIPDVTNNFSDPTAG